MNPMRMCGPFSASPQLQIMKRLPSSMESQTYEECSRDWKRWSKSHRKAQVGAVFLLGQALPAQTMMMMMMIICIAYTTVCELVTSTCTSMVITDYVTVMCQAVKFTSFHSCHILQLPAQSVLCFFFGFCSPRGRTCYLTWTIDYCTFCPQHSFRQEDGPCLPSTEGANNQTRRRGGWSRCCSKMDEEWTRD